MHNRKVAAQLRLNAKKRGEKQFSSNTPCSIRGGLVRYTSSGGCIACSKKRSVGRKEYLRNWYEENKNTTIKEYKDKNREVLKEKERYGNRKQAI